MENFADTMVMMHRVLHEIEERAIALADARDKSTKKSLLTEIKTKRARLDKEISLLSAEIRHYGIKAQSLV